jgi:TonB family protein
MKSCDYQVTMISSAGLLERLVTELLFLLCRVKRAWPSLRRDPANFARRATVECIDRVKRSFAWPEALAGALTALFVVLSGVLIVLLASGVPRNREPGVNESENLSFEMLTLPDEKNAPFVRVVDGSSQGRVGFKRNKGEGSEPEPKRSRGGGSGGLHNELAIQQGRIPQPSEVPAPIPQLPSPKNQTLPLAGIDIDPALWKDLPRPLYGDPNSNSKPLSNGPGEDGGMGNRKGLGIGDGIGPGVGPGENGNIGGGPRSPGGGGRGGRGDRADDRDLVIPVSLAEQRARVLSKPEPQYTEEARRNQITGTVILRVVFSRLGEVTNIRAIQSLPFGLTEKAIAAARQIRFSPALRNEHPVSVYMQLEYNFNLY